MGIQDAINKASQEAAEATNSAPAAQPNLPATQSQGGMPAPTQPGTPFSLDQFSPTTMSVDVFLKVKETGLKVGDIDVFFDDFIAIIDPNEIQVTQAIRYGSSPAVYVKTFDGVMASNGMSWQAAISVARQQDPKARPYPSADIPMTVKEDIVLCNSKGEQKGKVDAGTRLGYSLSTTNAGEFEKFKRNLIAQGLRDEPVEVKVGYRKRKNAAGNEWGIVTFDLIGAAGE